MSQALDPVRGVSEGYEAWLLALDHALAPHGLGLWDLDPSDIQAEYEQGTTPQGLALALAADQ